MWHLYFALNVLFVFNQAGQHVGEHWTMMYQRAGLLALLGAFFHLVLVIWRFRFKMSDGTCCHGNLGSTNLLFLSFVSMGLFTETCRSLPRVIASLPA